MRRSLLHSQDVHKRRIFRHGGLVIAFCFLLALFHVWIRMRVVQSGYSLRSLLEAQETLKGENHTLTLEAATLSSPVRLDKMALSLGLQRPPGQPVTLLSERSP